MATVGPACAAPEKLTELISAGVDVFRINTAHGQRQQHDRFVKNIRMAAACLDRPVGILVDLAGPKIRLGQLGEETLHCEHGAHFIFVSSSSPGRPDELTTNYPNLVTELSVGDRIQLADGTVSMRVTNKDADKAVCEVTNPGELRSRQGINLPSVKLSIPTLTERDIPFAIWAADVEADFISLSFVRSEHDVRQLSELLHQHNSTARVIAKIEKPEAMDNLDPIIRAAGGVMVARGDLGVEIDVAKTPIAQKQIIDSCMRIGRPVIVATQMLDSMQRSPRPTRAEASDVANAILDGTDACMLSGETAIGTYPVEAVKMMNRIMLTTEQARPRLPAREADETRVDETTTAALLNGATIIAEQIRAKLLVIATKTGATALVRARQRGNVRTVGVSNQASTRRQMTLFWGIEPIHDAPLEMGTGLRTFIETWGKKQGVLSCGDRVVIVTGTGFASAADNQVSVYEVD